VECHLLATMRVLRVRSDPNLIEVSLVFGMPSPTLPWPEEWSMPKRIRWSIAFSYLGLMGATCLYFGLAGVSAGEYAHVPLLLLGGLLCLIITIQGVLTRLCVHRGATGAIRMSTIPETGEAVVVFPYSAGQFWMLFSQTAIILCGFAVPVAAASVVEVSDTQEIGDMIIALVSLVAVGYFLALMCQFWSKKIARGYVAVGGAGIYHRSWAFTSFAPWQHVYDVRPSGGDDRQIRVLVDANAQGWSRRTSRFWKQPESCFGQSLTIRVMYLSVDPALVYHALQFYFENPRARSELSGDAAVRRLRRADIPVPSRPLRGGAR
jgi:hypothetical protein